jgi:hypothetical protein
MTLLIVLGTGIFSPSFRKLDLQKTLTNMKIANRKFMKTNKVGKIISRLFYRLLFYFKRIFTIINGG